VRGITVAFLLTVLSFFSIVAELFIPPFGELLEGSMLFLLPFGVFFLLSALVLAVTLKSEVSGNLRTFLLITGISGVGIPVSVVLHNIIYAIFIYLFGKGIWDGIGGDEPVFFILGLIVFPLCYVIGAAGTGYNLFIGR